MSSELEVVPALTTRRDVAVGRLQQMVSKGLGWARKYSLFQYPFVTACCGMEYMTLAAARYDLDRFGAALPRFSPRQADLLMVVGTVNVKQAPVLRRVWESIAEPKWVVAFGVCASSGGFYDNYATLQGIDQVIPVDVYVPGCPPRPEQVLDGIMMLQRKIQDQAHTLREPAPLPVIGAAPGRR
jgi:NADH-quinone oxidoreductase subunit B